jgi:hypothetical protein
MILSPFRLYPARPITDCKKRTRAKKNEGCKLWFLSRLDFFGLTEARKLLFRMEGALGILWLPEISKRKFRLLQKESRSSFEGFEAGLPNDAGGRQHIVESFVAE